MKLLSVRDSGQAWTRKIPRTTYKIKGPLQVGDLDVFWARHGAQLTDLFLLPTIGKKSKIVEQSRLGLPRRTKPPGLSSITPLIAGLAQKAG